MSILPWPSEASRRTHCRLHPKAHKFLGLLQESEVNLRLLVVVGDHDKLALQLRVFCEFLQNRSLDIGVSRNNVQEHTLEF